MPSLSNHQSQKATKMLFIGDSGVGKTGALASLVEAGYKLAIIDMDNGLDVLVHMIGSPQYPKATLDQVHFVTCTDKLKSVNGMLMPDGVPKAASKALKYLTNWKDEEEDLGPISKLGPEWVIVVDSLTFFGLAALRHILAVNGRSGQQPWQSDWGEAMRIVEDLLGMLYSDSIQANVIITSHIAYIESDTGAQIQRGLPMALGAKLPPKVPRYFNTVVLGKTKGSGTNAKKIIVTKSEGTVELKNPAPGKVPAELPLETGLAEIFRILQNK